MRHCLSLLVSPSFVSLGHSRDNGSNQIGSAEAACWLRFRFGLNNSQTTGPGAHRRQPIDRAARSTGVRGATIGRRRKPNTFYPSTFTTLLPTLPRVRGDTFSAQRTSVCVCAHRAGSGPLNGRARASLRSRTRAIGRLPVGQARSQLSATISPAPPHRRRG